MWKKQWKDAKNMRQKQSWDTDETFNENEKCWEKHAVAWMVVNILKICGWMRSLAWHAWNEAESFWEREWKIKTFWYGLQSNKKKTQGFVPSDSWKRKTVRFFALAPCHTELQHSCLRDAFYLHSIEHSFPTHKLKHPRNSSEQLLPEDPNCKEVCQATDAKRT